MFCTIEATVDSYDEAIPSVRVSIEAEEWEFDEAVATARKAVKDFYQGDETVTLDNGFENTIPADQTGDLSNDEYDAETCAGCPAEAECAAEAGLPQQQTADLGAIYGETPVLLFDPNEPNAEPLVVYLVDPRKAGVA